MRPFILILFLGSSLALANPLVVAENTPALSQSRVSSLLSQPSIQSIYFDENGLLWLSTLDGLHVFDGANLIHFSPSALGSNARTFPSRNVFSVFEDKSGNLWAATTDSGLLQLDRVSGKFFSPKHIVSDSFPAVGIVRTFVDSKGAIWIGHKKRGIKVVDYSFGVFQHLSEEYFDLGIAGFGEDRFGGVWAASSQDHLIQFTPERKEIKRILLSSICDSGDQDIRSFKIDIHNRAWIGTDRGEVFHADLNKSTCTSYLQKLKLPTPYSGLSLHEVEVGMKNDVLLATDRGLILVDKDELILRLESTNSALVDDEITALEQDGRGNYWVGTHNGLFILRSNEFPRTPQLPRNRKRAIVGFAETANQSIWIASYDELFRRDSDSNQMIPFEDVFLESFKPPERIMSLAASDKFLWLGMRSRGLVQIDLRNGTTQEFHKSSSNPLSSDEITKVEVLGDNSILVGTFGQGLNLITRDNEVRTFQKVGLPSDIQGQYIFDILELPSGLVLLGTENGLSLFDRSLGTFRKLDLETKQSHTSLNLRIWAMGHDSSGHLWIGTHGDGLFRTSIPNGETNSLLLESPTTDHLSKIYTVYSLEIDRSNDVWMATNLGLCRISQTPPVRLCFGSEHGLFGEELDFGASLASSKGELFFGGSDGFSSFYPQSLLLPISPPVLNVSSIKSDSNYLIQTPQSLSENQLDLSYRETNLQIEFSTLDFVAPTKNEFQFRLLNYEDDWNSVGSAGRATYTGLTAGQYDFQVRGANSAGVWSNKNINLRINLHGPPWKTKWVAFVCFMIAAAALFFIGKVYDNHLMRRRAELQAFRMERSADIVMDSLQQEVEYHTTLAKTLRAHAMRVMQLAKLSIQSSSVLIGQQPGFVSVETTVDRLEAMQFVHECLHQRGALLFVDLHRYANITYDNLLNGNAGIRNQTLFTNSVTKTLFPEESATYIALAIYELLDNSLRHAFVDQEPPYYLGVELTKTGYDENDLPTWILAVTDNGIGLKEFDSDEQPGTTGFRILYNLCSKLDAELVIEQHAHGSRVALIHGTGEQGPPPRDVTTL